jgi:hypothetical protein
MHVGCAASLAQEVYVNLANSKHCVTRRRSKDALSFLKVETNPTNIIYSDSNEHKHKAYSCYCT